MSSFKILDRKERLRAALVAVTLSIAVLSATLLLFASDGNTPWFDADARLAKAAERCTREATSTHRHECLRVVARIGAQEVGVVARR